MQKILTLTALLIAASLACNFAATPPPQPAPVTETFSQPEVSPTSTFTASPIPATETFTPPAPTATNLPTAIPAVESLKAVVTAELLSCRYGPGAEYLYLYGLRQGANIELIGRTEGNNWVEVAGKNLCWVNAKYLNIQGNQQTLKITYPAEYKLPVSPYYAPPVVLSATRNAANPNQVTVTWTDITLRAGDEEDANMFIYIIEVWRCEGGKIVFDPLASNYPEVTFTDESGCSAPSHGRVFFQEKHGFAGPAEIPWPKP
ncbi:MAG: hypothetical protein IT310_14010 [Anaerolineales bacterium]|nr:hypothetical protein [Anaerolineales bacterium]